MFAIKLKNGTSAGWLAGAWVCIGFSSVYCFHANREISSYFRCSGGQIPLLWQFYSNIIVQTQRRRCCANACFRNEKDSNNMKHEPECRLQSNNVKIVNAFVSHWRVTDSSGATIDDKASSNAHQRLSTRLPRCAWQRQPFMHILEMLSIKIYSLFVCFRGNDCYYFGTIHLLQFSPRALIVSIFHFPFSTF